MRHGRRRPTDGVARHLPPRDLSPILVKLHNRKDFWRWFFSNPALLLVSGFALLIVLGGGLLMLPIAQTDGGITPPLIAFFTATSAVTTTGLTLVPTATYWTFFGQAVICGLIFVGGLGTITVAAFALVLAGVRIPLPGRHLIAENLAEEPVGGIIRVLKSVVIVDLVITLVGAALLISPLLNYYGLKMTLWQALFDSVSAFNTAGFDIVGPASFIPVRTDYAFLSIVTILEVLGAIGFSALLEIPRVRRFRRFSLDTKLVIVTTLALYLLATVVFLLSESLLGQTLNGFSIGDKIFTAFYNGVSASSTTGFATIDFSQVTIPVLAVFSAVMFIGGATGSTAGGIKVNTFAVMMATVWSTLKGKRQAEAFGREIAFGQVLRALAVAALSAALVVSAVFVILMSSPGVPLEKVLFEATSAFGTAGLSSGALSDFSPLSQIVVICLMFVGRVTALSAVLVFSERPSQPHYRFAEEWVRLG